MISFTFYICFSIETGAIEAFFKHECDAIDFWHMYPQVLKPPIPYIVTYNAVLLMTKELKEQINVTNS